MSRLVQMVNNLVVVHEILPGFSKCSHQDELIYIFDPYKTQEESNSNEYLPDFPYILPQTGNCWPN